MESCRLWLHETVQENKAQRIRRLVGDGKDANEKDDSGQTPLHIAAESGNAEIVRLLLSLKAYVDVADRNLMTPLHVCAKRNKTDVLIVLLEFGAHVNAVDKKRRSALHIAAEANHVEIVKTLIENGARLDLANEDGDTALFVAVENGCWETVDKMLRCDADGIVHARDYFGKTPLHVAVILEEESIVRALINAGARKDIKDEDGKIPRDYVKDNRELMKELLAVCQPQNSGGADSLDSRRACRCSFYAAEWPRRSPCRQSSLQPIVSSTHSRLQGHHFASNGLHTSASLSSKSQSASCTSSDSKDWTPNRPFGSRSRMLKKLRTLNTNDVLADSYTICAGSVAGKPHMRYARHRSGEREAVVIKFYCEEDVYSHVRMVHSATHESRHICSMIERLKPESTGFPPSFVFEKGSKTLKEWLREEERSLLEKRLCVRQVLLGLKDAHSRGFVHGNLKPSHIMWFGDEAKWKLLDWDGARKEGAETVVAMSPHYSAPEITASFHNFGVLPLVRRSLDIWSFGILAYEVLTGTPFFEDDTSLEDTVKLDYAGEVDKKLGQIQDVTEREVLSRFLAFAPDERWSVTDALQHDLFSSDELTTRDVERYAGPGTETCSGERFAEHFNIVSLRFDWISSRGNLPAYRE